jgi:rubrerythrin
MREIRTETVYEGPEAEAVLVKLALEREGIRCFIVAANAARARLRGAVHVSPSNAERARQIVTRHLKGASVSEAALMPAWRCVNCGEMVEGQFQACWKCGRAKM